MDNDADKIVPDGGAEEKVDTSIEEPAAQTGESVPEPTTEGENVSPETENAAEAVSTEETPVNEAADQAANNTIPEENISTGSTQSESKSPVTEAENQKKSKAPVILGGILAILAFVLIICGALIFNNEKPAEKKNSSNNETAQEEKKELEPSELRLAGNQLSDFDLYFLKNNSKEENLIYSPLSIKYALSMLSKGTNGETKEQIDNVIGDYAAKSYLNSQNRSLANALFVRNDAKELVLDSYISGLKNDFGADVVFDDFANAQNINSWISNQTLGIIDKMLDDSAVQDLDYALINALAIDMNWHYALQSSDGTSAKNRSYSFITQHEDYHDSVKTIFSGDFETDSFNGTEGVEVAKIGASVVNYDILKELGEDKIRETVEKEYRTWLKNGGTAENGVAIEKSDAEISEFIDEFVKELDVNYHKYDYSTDFYFTTSDSEKVFAKDLKEYDGATLQYVAIMPTDEDLNSYLAGTDAQKISDLIADLKTIEPKSFDEGSVYKINGVIPFFKYNASIDLTKELPKLGITDVFDHEKANLSNMISAENQAIDAAMHNADIEFSNDGIKAAATTALGGLGETAGDGFDYLFDVPVVEIDLTFDKPFFYLIRDKATGEIWFSGATYEIDAKN